MYATANVVVFAILVWLSARHMNKEYLRRSRAEIGIRELNADLEVRVADRTKALEQQTIVLTEQAALLDLAHDAVYVRDMDNRISSGIAAPKQCMAGLPKWRWEGLVASCSRRSFLNPSRRSTLNCVATITGKARRFTTPAMARA